MSNRVDYAGRAECGCPYINQPDPERHWKDCHYRLNSQQAEPAPAQDEREAVEAVGCIDLSTDAGVVLYANRDHWLDFELLMTIAQHERIVASLTRPAQTEQQPVGVPVPDIGAIIRQIPTGYFMGGRRGQHAIRESVARLAEQELRQALAAAPIVQTDPQPEQSGLVEAAKAFADAARKNIYPCPDKPNSLSGKLQNLDRAIAAALSAQGGEQ